MALPAIYSSAQLPTGSTSGTIADFGSALSINFSGQTINSAPSAFTVAGWVRLLSPPSPSATLFSVSNQFQVSIDSSGILSAQFTGGTGATESEIGITDQGWHYVGVSFLQSVDGSASGTLSLFLDGFQVDSQNVTSGASLQPGDCAVGVNAACLDFAAWSMWSSPVATDIMDVPLWGAPAAGQESDEALVAAWNFANGPAADQSGNGGTAIVAQQLWHVPCVAFGPGSSSVPAAADALNPGGGPFTVMGWALVTAGSPNGQYYLVSNVQTGVSMLQLYVSNDDNGAPVVNFYFGEPNVGDLQGDLYVANPMQWTHLALTYSGTVVTFYINGNSTGGATGSPPAIQTANVTVGSQSASATGSFNMQGLSIWTQALDQSDIQNYMNGSDPTGETGCVAFYPFAADLGNTVTGTSLTPSGGVAIAEYDAPLSAFQAAAPAPAAVSTAAGDTPIMQFSDYKALARQHGIDVDTVPDATSDPDLAAPLEWYAQFLKGIPPRTAGRLRNEFARNLHIGLELGRKGIRTNPLSVAADGQDLVIRHDTPEGPRELARITIAGAVSPFLTWALTVTIDVVGIIAAMLGIFSTAAKVQGAVSFEEELLNQLGLAAQGAENADRSVWALSSIWKMLKVMWEWKILFTLFKRLITGSWWSLTFTILSLIAQVAALIASGGYLIALKVAQMAIAVGQLIYDLLQMPTSAETQATAQR